MRLPAERFAVTTVYLRGTGLYHGTLPTSYPHNNHGSALVSKTKTMDILKRHRDGCPNAAKESNEAAAQELEEPPRKQARTTDGADELQAAPLKVCDAVKIISGPCADEEGIVS